MNNTLWSSLNAWKGPWWENFPNLFHREQGYKEFRFFPVTLSSLRVHFIPFLNADSLTRFFLPDVREEGYWTALPNCIFSTTPVSVYDPLTFQHLGMFLYFRMTLLSESLSLLISHDLFSLLSGMSNKWCTQALCFLLAILQPSWPLYRCLGCHSLFLLGKFCHIETNTTVVDISASTALQKYWTQDCCSHSWREALKFSIYIYIPTCVDVCIHYV